MATADVETEGYATVQGGHPWCNPFSKQSRRWYHFDVEYSDQKCEDGACAAIQLVRDAESPVLNIYGGQQWRVNKDDNGELSWDLYSPGPERSDKIVMNLLDVVEITFMDAEKAKEEGKGYPDTLEITLKSKTGNYSGHNKKEIFTIEGGLYYDEKILNRGFDEITSRQYKEWEENATQSTRSATGARKGKWVGGVGSALVVGGMYTAATVTGVAVQTQALIGAALVGIIGGTIVGALAGGIIGLGITVAIAIAGYKTVRGHTIKPASRKIFEKLRCLKEMKVCSKNVLVPEGSPCPRKT